MSQKLGRAAFYNLIAALTLILGACSSPSSTSPTTTPSRAAINYYATDTASLPLVPDEAESTPIASEPQASPTPITYTIVAGDTLLGIAERHGISLDELLVANPAVDARFLSIGQEILIPLAGSAINENIESASLPDLGQGPLRCLGGASGELWCFFQVSNHTDSAVENAIAEIQLFDENGQPVAQIEAFGLIQKLDSGTSMPLVAYWPAAPAGWQQSTASLSSAFRLDDPTTRYVQVSVESLDADIAANGLSAQIAGELSSDEFSAVTNLRLLAVAYDADGLAVGLRRTELTAVDREFSFEVYSLGPLIASVEILVEALR